MYISLAKPVAPYSDPDLVTVGWNENAVGPSKQSLFSGGYCAECRSPIGVRNSSSVVLSRSPKADICGFEERMTSLLFVSETILSVLSENEVLLLQPREVSFEKPSTKRRRYFEITGEPNISQVGVRGGKYWRLACFECGSCGYRAFSCSHPSLGDTARANDFLARSDMCGDLNSLFLVRDALGRTKIAMSFERFSAFASKLQGVSLWPSRLFCLTDAEVERHPGLPSFSTLC